MMERVARRCLAGLNGMRCALRVRERRDRLALERCDLERVRAPGNASNSPAGRAAVR